MAGRRLKKYEFIPPGFDPTKEEYEMPGPSCSGCFLKICMVIGLIWLAWMGFQLYGPKQTPKPPAALQMPSDTPTGTLKPTDTPTKTLTPTNTATLTPSHTPTGTLPPSNTPTDTPTKTLTPSKTPRPTRTPRPPRPRPSGNNGVHVAPTQPLPVLNSGNFAPIQPPSQPPQPVQPVQPTRPAPTMIGVPLQEPPTDALATMTALAQPTNTPSATPTDAPTIETQ
jgi:hypothetical protein